MGVVDSILAERGNNIFVISSDMVPELKVDQSLAHNGVCLTVEKLLVAEKKYQVTAINETLEKTMLGDLKKGERINLERSLLSNGRVDGHFVQGHVDTCGTILEIKELEGSWEYFVKYPPEFESLVVNQGSIALNGISLTIARSLPAQHVISVCIIPYTSVHTNIGDWQVGNRINIEFDVLGKYVKKILSTGSLAQ